MKAYTILVVMWLCLGPLQAQQIIEKHLDFSGKESLSMKIQIADSINIRTWNKNEVYVKASIKINDNKDNEAYETSFNDNDSKVSIAANFRENYFKGRRNCCNETDICWQIFVPENTRFSLETIDGNVTITGKTQEMSVKSISGYIDLAVPANKKADLEFSTISGRMYSDLDLIQNKIHSGIPMKITEKLNNGGDPIKLETISGDIYFRKSTLN